ncbi:MAG: sigma 54-interacting transcriptional regulator [Planctomycetota bacterium]|nr:sigma 54-interacting transcriptional regulator [Planctomycetota bacterium]
MSEGTFLLLVVRDGQTETHAFRQDVISIGRSRECDVCLPDREVSRMHCRVERIDGLFTLVDQGAANPVRLRNRPVVRAEIKVGDSFQCGSYEITLQLPDEQQVSVDETRVGTDRRGAQDLSTFLTIARAVNEGQDLSRLLTQIVDAAIALCGAERGFLILVEGSEQSVEVARNFAQEEVATPEDKVSRTIARRVLETGVPELTTNAQEDDRFRDLQSVADLRLRSILCIPIRIAGKIGGVLYVDNRLQMQVFQEREKLLLISLADHAGVAIHNAQTMEQLRARQSDLQAALERVDQLNAALKGQLRETAAELSEAREELSVQSIGRRNKFDYRQIVGTGRAMRAVFGLLDKYIEAGDPVLVTGESGTGKELVARAIHKQSTRKDQPFIGENCAALPEALLESELFGYVKGAFTGAVADKKGLLEAAHGGVLFLDEVGDMPLDLQSKLLRVLQDGEVRPLGSSAKVSVDVRLITATNRNLDEMVRDGEFREDLFYRVSVLPLHLPPLRERREDVPHLIKRFLADVQRETGSRIRVSAEAMEKLSAYSWPGNVRDLQNELRRASILCDGIILESHLSEQVRTGESAAASNLADDGSVPAERGTSLPDMVVELEVREIRKAWEKARGNKSRAADMLGLSRFALQRKLEKYGIGDDKDGSVPENSNSGS